MAKKTKRDRAALGELQLAILQVLWERGEASASEVHSSLHGERGLAPTTIATMLTKLEDKGVVTHRNEGRRYIYRATVAKDEVDRSMVSDLVVRLFDGDPLQLVHHLIDAQGVDPGELRELTQRIAQHQQERDDERA